MSTQGKTGLWYKKGTVLRRAINVGPWVEIIATVDGVDYHIGTVKEGNLIFEARMKDHTGAKSAGQIKDIRIPTKVAVEFRGIMEEIHRENILLLLNHPPDESKFGDPGDI